MPAQGGAAHVPARLQLRLDGPADLEGFRRAARRLIAQGLRPEEVEWFEGGTDPCGPGSLWEEDASDAWDRQGAQADAGPVLRVPAGFAALCDQALLHAEPQRFALMYRLLWRLLHEPGLRHDPLDADMQQARALARAVQRDIHKMRAFVRFTRLEDDRHVAWFEPAHHIVEANAGFFMRRFANMRWAILTPRRSVEWDGAELRFGPGADRREKPPPDAGEHLWLTYYQHIFNPARLKLATMRREMPARYWRNLPEAALIQPLAGAAEARSRAMVDAAPTPARRIRPPIALHLAPSGEAPRTLQDLRAATRACRDCPIGALATQSVCGEGPLQPSHMLVGEQPGDQEDLAGRPFVGPAGQLLDRALDRLGWPREQLFLANAVKHFKYELRGKRRLHKTAAQREADACLGWLDHEIAIVRPRALVALGATAARALLGRPVAVQAERGAWIEHERADGLPVFVTLHPSALLRLPDAERAAAWQRWLADLALARQRG